MWEVILTKTGPDYVNRYACLLFTVYLMLFPSFLFAQEVVLNDLVVANTRVHPEKSGVYVLEKGGEALLARAWLTEKAVNSIDVQYFIWSTDNIGMLAAEALLAAAERGVHVRVLVDDFLIDADTDDLFALAYHPNIEVRIYNPTNSVGVSLPGRIFNIITDLRGSNQRMHNKLFVVDDQVAITGGRNMANEYFDFGHEYNFRDRDVLLVGKVITKAKLSFDDFWNSKLAVPLERLVSNPFEHDVEWKKEDEWGDEADRQDRITQKELDEVTQEKVAEIYNYLHEYARDENNYLPEVRASLADIDKSFGSIIQAMHWVDVDFISDRPGKNNTWFNFSLGGGGKATTALAELLQSAKESVVIQTPYLIISPDAWGVFEKVLQRGVNIKINTNSLASTDNLPAFSGYSSQLDKMVDAGIEVFEYRPDAKRREELVKKYTQYDDELPIFSLHAKTMVVDNRLVYIGTFNLDPRSENLNTEIGVVIDSPDVAKLVRKEIETDMAHGNSWDVGVDGHNNDTSIIKRSRLLFWKLMPIESML